MEKEILQEIIQNFEVEKFITFFRRKNPSFRPSDNKDLSNIFEYSKAQLIQNKYVNLQELGKIEFENKDRLIICAIESLEELSERSSKKRQYEIARQIIKFEQFDAGIFIFYDESGNFRFSLVYEIPLGRKRTYSNFKRFTYFVEKTQTNKTFLIQIGEGDFSSLDSIKQAFSVEKVTDEFFEAYRFALNEVIIKSLNKYDVEYRIKHSYA